MASSARERTVLDSRRSEFERSAASLSTVAASMLGRDADLLVAAGSAVVTNPAITNSQFQAWVDRAVLPRYPSLLAVGYVERVPAARLAEFADAAERDPSPLNAGEPFAVVPPGERAEYCLLRVNATGAAASTLEFPPGLDLCMADGLSEVLETSGSSGNMALLPLEASEAAEIAAASGSNVGVSEAAARNGEAARVDGFVVAVAQAVYAATPATDADRRQQLHGWISAVFDGPSIIRSLTQGHEDLALTLRWTAGEQDIVVARQVAPFLGVSMRHEQTFDDDGRWTLEIEASATEARTAARDEARIVLVVGLLITGLVSVMVWLLVGSRNRALRLVEAKTEELRYQAEHDLLTGLPNRGLVERRARDLLRRSDREGTTPVALFVDLDYFKVINDTFGHATGDRLLCAVAERLRTAVRDGDAVARLGGDEFVVVIAASHPGEPEVVAQRIHDELSAPFVVGTPAPLSVHASIGIASGKRLSVDDLLRDADVALYQAKAAGRGRSVVFAPEMRPFEPELNLI